MGGRGFASGTSNGPLVRLIEAEVLFEESAVRAVGDQLDRLVELGHTRLLLNLGGVRYMSGALLGRLAGLHKRIKVGVAGSNSADWTRCCRTCCGSVTWIGCSTPTRTKRRRWDCCSADVALPGTRLMAMVEDLGGRTGTILYRMIFGSARDAIKWAETAFDYCTPGSFSTFWPVCHRAT